MKKVLIIMVSLFAALVWGCTADLDSVNERLDDLESRIENLEELCAQINTNISSLQAIINALQDNDYITAVVPVVRDGEIIGYTITFSKSGPVTIYNGTDGQDGKDGADGDDGRDGEDGMDGNDGQDGHSPEIGVRKDTDGTYYWTLDGEWLLDDSGARIPAEGADGITPQLKIENGYWYISYDGGTTWTQLGQAVVEGGDSMFEDIYEQDGNVYFVLSSGETIVIPMQASLDIVFTYEPGAVCMDGETLRIPYEVVGADEWTEVICVGSNGWDAFIEAEDYSHGCVAVTNNVADKDGSVLVFANNSDGNTVTKALVFNGGVLYLAMDVVCLDGDAAVVDVELSTNTDYQVLIPEEAQGWISVVEGTKSEVRTETVRLAVAEYISGPDREALVQFVVEGRPVNQCYIRQFSGESLAVDFSKQFFRRSLLLTFRSTNCSYDLNMDEAVEDALGQASGRIVPMRMYGPLIAPEFIIYEETITYMEMMYSDGFPCTYVNYYAEVQNHDSPKASGMMLDLAEEAAAELPANTGLAGMLYLAGDGHLQLQLYVASRASGDYFLNVFVLEDGVVGYQSGADNSEDYVHNYVVRGQMTDIYGDPVSLQEKDCVMMSLDCAVPEDVADARNLYVVAYLTYEGQFASAVADVPYVETGYVVDNAVTIPLGGVARFEYEE